MKFNIFLKLIKLKNFVFFKKNNFVFFKIQIIFEN